MSTRQSPPEPLLAFEASAPAVIKALAILDSQRARFAAEQTAGHILPNVLEAIRIELTYHSNAIEGNTLTLRETQLVLEGRTPAGGKSLREIYEARNHDRAIRMVESWARKRPTGTLLTTDDLLDTHAIVLADIDPAGAGRFRTERVLIAGTRFVPPGPHRFGELIPRMLELANCESTHPVLRAAELHYNLAAIHPFRDGNGRTARLLMNLQLLASGFPHAIIDVSKRAEYLAALDDANTGSSERFALFVASSLGRSIERAIGGLPPADAP